MGTEILFLVLPITVLHLSCAAFKSAPKGRRLIRLAVVVSFVLGVLGLAFIATGSIRGFLYLVAVIYTFIILPASLVASIYKKIHSVFKGADRFNHKSHVQQDAQADSSATGGPAA